MKLKKLFESTHRLLETNADKKKFINKVIHNYKNQNSSAKLNEDAKQDTERDNKGNHLSQQQSEFFKNSKIRDANGRLVVCYHSTDKEFSAFDKAFVGSGFGNSFGNGFYFSDTPIAEYGKSIEVYLNSRKPYTIKNIYNINDIIEFLNNCGANCEVSEIMSWFEFYSRDGKATISKVLEEYDLEDLSELKQKGYDGIIIRNAKVGVKNKVVIDREYVVFEPNQIKLVSNSEPTNSNNLTEQLDTTNIDSEGNELSKAQIAFFKNSKCRDSQGHLLVCYHGTDKNFTVFNKGDIGFHFGTKDTANNRASYKNTMKWSIGAYYLNIQQPLYLYDYNEWHWGNIVLNWFAKDSEDADYILENEIIPDTLNNQVKPIFNDSLSELQMLLKQLYKLRKKNINDSVFAYNSKYSIALRQIIIKHGYDGIVYENEFELGGLSYICLQSNQIKSIFNKTPTTNNNINEHISNIV